MFEWFSSQGPLLQAFMAGMFTWILTLVGSVIILVRKDLPDLWLDMMSGFAAGVMIAASFWSLLSPAIEIAEARDRLPAWLVAAGGFFLGATALRVADRIIPHLHPGLKKAEGPHSSLRRSTLLFLAMTLHNIPEGLAIGVAFGAVAAGTDFVLGSNLSAAMALAMGIGIQNLPEGIAVAMPLRRAGLAPWRCFHAGHLSAIVEPFAAVFGAWLVIEVEFVLPWALAFAAGAMMFVVIEELIPESQSHDRVDLATLSTIVGFMVMMVLDVALS